MVVEVDEDASGAAACVEDAAIGDGFPIEFFQGSGPVLRFIAEVDVGAFAPEVAAPPVGFEALGEAPAEGRRGYFRVLSLDFWFLV